MRKKIKVGDTVLMVTIGFPAQRGTVVELDKESAIAVVRILPDDLRDADAQDGLVECPFVDLRLIIKPIIE